MEFLLHFFQNFLFFALHIDTYSSFPKPLSKKDETMYFNHFRKYKDTESRDVLIRHNLRLVAHIAKKYFNQTGDQDDLISIGTLGLIKAIDTFDNTKGTRFATYGARCIENEILMYFRSIRKTTSDIYISDPLDTDEDGNSLSLLDIISGEEDLSERVGRSLDIIKVRSLLSQVLTKREQEIIAHRYGLNNLPPQPQREIAKSLGISRSYVSRIEKNALEKLRSALEKPSHPKAQ